MSNKNAIIGFLAGATAGALIGVLYAPEKGEKTRKNIKKKSSRYAEDMKDSVNEFLDDVKERVEGMKKEANETASNAKEKVDELKKKATAASN